MAYTRRNTTDGVTIMNKDLYDNLQDGIEQFGVTPQMFGAVGDGVHDDTESIQSAIDYLPNGGILYFPIGKYVVSSGLSVSHKRIHIYGKIITDDFSHLSGSTILWNGPENSTILTSISPISISNLIIDGNSTITSNTPSIMGSEDGSPTTFIVTKEGIVGIDTQGSQGLLDKVYVLRCSSIGFKVNTYNRLSNCVAKSCGFGYELTWDNQLTQCKAVQCQVSIHYKHSSTNVVEGFRSDGCTKNVLLFEESCVSEVVTGLVADQCGECGINIKGTLTGCDIQGVLHRCSQMSRNIGIDSIYDNPEVCSAVHIQSYCESLKINVYIPTFNGSTSYGDGSKKLIFPKTKIFLNDGANLSNCDINIGGGISSEDENSIYNRIDFTKTSSTLNRAIVISSNAWIQSAKIGICTDTMVFRNTKFTKVLALNNFMPYCNEATNNILYLQVPHIGCMAMFKDSLYVSKSLTTGDWVKIIDL